MKVTPKYPEGKFPLSLLPGLSALGYSLQSDFHLKTGEVYTVYGVMVYKGLFFYLIIPTDEFLPSWEPASLFTIIDHRLPFEWYLSSFDESRSGYVEFLLGYKELVLEENHYDSLLERDKAAIAVFLTRKKEIDEET